MDVAAEKNPSATNVVGKSVSALLLVGGKPGVERFGDLPLALLDVLGRSLVLRAVDRLKASGIAAITVLSDTPAPQLSHKTAAPWINASWFNIAAAEDFWDEALEQFRRLARQSECVLVMRLGAWAEIDYAAFLTSFRSSNAALMRAHCAGGEPLDVYAISPTRYTEAVALFRGKLRDPRTAAAAFPVYGYVNLLRDAADLRALTLDAFAGEARITPDGNELRPGVWVGRGARIHPSARLVAPVFIGARCRIHSAAVITRGSSLERNSVVDCATVIDNSTVLPFTRVGAGLEAEQCVLDAHMVHSLPRSATVAIDDPRLLRPAAAQLFAQVFAMAGWLHTLLPEVMRRLLAEDEQPTAAATLQPGAPTLGSRSLAPVESQTEPYREMVATRRYGNE